jgi:hypothetical protein
MGAQVERGLALFSPSKPLVAVPHTSLQEVTPRQKEGDSPIVDLHVLAGSIYEDGQTRTPRIEPWPLRTHAKKDLLNAVALQGKRQWIVPDRVLLVDESHNWTLLTEGIQIHLVSTRGDVSTPNGPKHLLAAHKRFRRHGDVGRLHHHGDGCRSHEG